MAQGLKKLILVNGNGRHGEFGGAMACLSWNGSVKLTACAVVTLSKIQEVAETKPLQCAMAD